MTIRLGGGIKIVSKKKASSSSSSAGGGGTRIDFIDVSCIDKIWGRRRGLPAVWNATVLGMDGWRVVVIDCAVALSRASESFFCYYGVLQSGGKRVRSLKVKGHVALLH